MKRSLVISLVAVALGISGVVFANGGTFSASRTFEFDPDKTGCSTAAWSKGDGQLDNNCKTNFGLLLAKNCSTPTNASAGAVLNGLHGTIVECGTSSFGYDIKDGSPCEAGSPRFNVQYITPEGDTGFSFVGGCANGTKTDLGNGWGRVTLNPCDATDAFPVIPAGSKITSVVLVVDDMGSYVLDNIQVNGAYADKPGAAGALPACE